MSAPTAESALRFLAGAALAVTLGISGYALKIQAEHGERISRMERDVQYAVKQLDKLEAKLDRLLPVK